MLRSPFHVAGRTISLVSQTSLLYLFPHVTSTPVKPGKSRQIFGNATTDRVRLIRQDQPTAGMGSVEGLWISTEQHSRFKRVIRSRPRPPPALSPNRRGEGGLAVRAPPRPCSPPPDGARGEGRPTQRPAR